MQSVGDQSITALVEYQVRTENASVAEWLDVWNERATDAFVGEPETDAYASAVNIDDESQVLVFERYAHGDASLKAHIDRPAHAALMEAMGAAGMTKRQVLSTIVTDQPDYGWWSRTGSTGPTPEGALLIISGMAFAEPGHRERFIELASAHATYCHEHEPGMLICAAGSATADADREIDLRRGELVFVLCFADEAARDAHFADPRHKALEAQLAEEGIAPESRFLRTYRTTGHGFLWRE